jgi:hypothetical protein
VGNVADDAGHALDALLDTAGGAGDLGSVCSLLDNVVDGANHVVVSLLSTAGGAGDLGSVSGLLGTVTDAGDLGRIPEVIHDVGTIVASIASFDPGNSTGGLTLTGLTHDTIIDAAAVNGSAQPNVDASGILHDARSVDYPVSQGERNKVHRRSRNIIILIGNTAGNHIDH